MAKVSTINELLASDASPSASCYESVLDCVIRDPASTVPRAGEPGHDVLVLNIVSRSYRISHLLERLHTFLATHPTCATQEKVAAMVFQLLLSILPYLVQMLEMRKVVELLAPALLICFSPPVPPPNMQSLAVIIADSGNLVELLSSDERGSHAVMKWASLSRMAMQDHGAVASWTRKLMTMASTCIADHDIGTEMRQWNSLQELTQGLYQIKHDTRKGSAAQMTDNRRYGTAGHYQPSASFPALDPKMVRILKELQLSVPSSERVLRQVIDRLEGEKTIELLVAVAKTFPCKLCNSDLNSMSLQEANPAEASNDNGIIEQVPDLHLELLGEAVGNWKILLSDQALKSVQRRIVSGLAAPVKDRLVDMAAGYWDYKLAGSKNQRKRLRVRLAATESGRDLAILWQVDVGVVHGCTQQIIKVWELGDSLQISKAIDRVAVLHTSYSAETISRCSKTPDTYEQRYIPTIFEDVAQQLPKHTDHTGGLDIRVLDQETIEMANKFYAFTEPLIRSILAKDISAEFPFDLSKDEAVVINHSHTASLILGRSGTGKTTCLIFKLVAQYLARRRVKDEKPKRQILVTRSSFLADRIRAYTLRLIATPGSKSSNDGFEQDMASNPTTDETKSIQNTVLALSDESFPLVCTFDDFLELLENSIV